MATSLTHWASELLVLQVTTDIQSAALPGARMQLNLALEEFICTPSGYLRVHVDALAYRFGWFGGEEAITGEP